MKRVKKQNIDASNNIIITFHDKDFNIIRANKRAREVLGLPPLEGTEVKCFKYYHGRDCPPKNCPSCKCLLSREPVTFEIFEPHLNKYIEIRALPSFDKNDEFMGLLHIVRDITPRSKR